MKQYIIFLILEIMMISTMVYCIKQLNEKKINLKFWKLIIIFALSNIVVINNLYSPNEIKIIISLTVNIVINKIIFDDSIKQTITWTLIFSMINILIELLFILIFSPFPLDNVNDFNNTYFVKILICALVSISTMKIFKINKFTEIIKKIKITIFNRINILRSLAFIAILLNLIDVFLSKNLNDEHLIVLSISSLIFMIYCGYEIINDKYNILILKQLNTNLNSSINAYSETIDSCREFKHNLKNDLFALKSTLSKKEQEKINEIIQKYNNNYNWISNLSEIPEGLQGLIFIKQKEAKEKNIDIVCDIKNKIKIKEQDYFIICEIVGILLDNSIEASVNAKSKSIVINIKEEKNKMIIQIINKFKSILDLSRITEKNYSTKKKKSGIGLNYINKIQKNNINVDYQVINDLFYATVEYSKKVKK